MWKYKVMTAALLSSLFKEGLSSHHWSKSNIPTLNLTSKVQRDRVTSMFIHRAALRPGLWGANAFSARLSRAWPQCTSTPLYTLSIRCVILSLQTVLQTELQQECAFKHQLAVACGVVKSLKCDSMKDIGCCCCLETVQSTRTDGELSLPFSCLFHRRSPAPCFWN